MIQQCTDSGHMCACFEHACDWSGVILLFSLLPGLVSQIDHKVMQYAMQQKPTSVELVQQSEGLQTQSRVWCPQPAPAET